MTGKHLIAPRRTEGFASWMFFRKLRYAPLKKKKKKEKKEIMQQNEADPLCLPLPSACGYRLAQTIMKLQWHLGDLSMGSGSGVN